jgi:hypothetical protein
VARGTWEVKNCGMDSYGLNPEGQSFRGAVFRAACNCDLGYLGRS